MPVRSYTNWNSRPSGETEQVEPYRKYFFICEGANTETFYFRSLINLRKSLGIHPLIDIRLWEKTGQDKDISYVKNLFAFAEKQKHNIENDFDVGRDKMIIVFDGDIFEDKVLGYEDLVKEIESKDDVVAVTNPNFELFLLLHIADSFNKHIKGRERDFLTKDKKGRFSYAATVLRQLTNMNSKTNSKIGELAENIFIAIEQEKHVNQDIHQIRGKVSSNIAKIIEEIIKENPTV